ncbi:hypothetical protein K435DRAFT_33468 [Dendrothele bispora CBS 962.96]|uniref:Protein kinase domain-containing protein n=1 Tax=Dendrothele bispora (strain CBS 962.96) TaxID=1314807 RepID=A0A4S8M7I8_DENBC|nr:hypothetical protein K435DRAFT_33468 [Dendrothele bispora CBS 962.96]
MSSLVSLTLPEFDPGLLRHHSAFNLHFGYCGGSRQWYCLSDLQNISELGMGNRGSVMKVLHVPSRVIMTEKLVLIDAKPSIRK